MKRSTASPEARAADLRQRIDRANHAYYVLDAPEIADAEYDALFRELQALEVAHPALVDADSPTQRLGAAPAAALVKHPHRRRMLSLANAFDADELAAWEDRNARLKPEVREAGYLLEIKIDGAAVSLTYEHGRLTVGATRGNGQIGETVTANLQTLADIPNQLKGKGHPALMEVRGEVYIPYKSFEKVNAEREAAGEPLLANPRNSAAGGLRQLDPAMTRKRRLAMFAFQVEVIDGAEGPTTQTGMLDQLEAWGFKVEPHRRRVASLAEVQAAVPEYEALLAKLPFQADGLVVKVDQRALQRELGDIGGREPRWAIARKFAPEVATTRLKQIHVNVGRTGALNPWAELEPVELGGVVVANATLHNFELIAQKDIRDGDLVEVVRAGEVIPQIIGVAPGQDPKKRSKPYQEPARCPVCNTPVDRPEDEVMLYCPNGACPGRVLEGLIHFASRHAMDIRGLGIERVRQLRDAGLVQNVADIYVLTAEQLEALEGFAKTSARQLVDAIAASKTQPLSLVLFGLGIRHVGETVAKLLARRFGTMRGLLEATPEAIHDVAGVGPTIADAVTGWCQEPHNRKLVQRLEQLGLTMTEPDAGPAVGPLTGMTYVVTGTLPTLSRDDAEALIERAGGKAGKSVSKKTTAVVAGTDAGSKLEKAQSLGIEIIDEAELVRRAGAATAGDQS